MKDKHTQYLNKVSLQQGSRRASSLLIRLEQKQALRDLQSHSYFSPLGGGTGPFTATISIKEDNLVIKPVKADGSPLSAITFSLIPFRRLIHDYYLIVESYEKARLEGAVSRLEAIDFGRRGLHNEGAQILQERLSPDVEVDFETARRFFTLICVLCAGRGALWT